ncbi:hypothetical protein FB107DRAFT_274186 [Schizophyllum commune]
MVLKNVTYDDRDITNIHYNNWWFTTGSYNATSVGETGTLSSSNSPDASLVFTFPQPATAFYYYGMLRSGGGWYLMCIDCDPNDQLWDHIDAHNASDDGRNPPILLYTKTWHEPGVHEVILQNTNDTRFGKINTQITLDRFILTIDDGTAGDANERNPTPTSSSTSEELGSITSTFSSTASSSSSSSSATSVAASYSKRAPVGAVSGAVAGAVLFVVIVSFCWWRRHRRSRLSLPSSVDHPRSPTEPSPYMKGRPPSLTTTSTTPGLSPYVGRGHPPEADRKRADSDTQGPPTPSYRPLRVRKPPLDIFSVETSMSSVLDDRTQTPSSDVSSTRAFIVPRREIDAGPADDEVLEDVLPPDYDDATRHRRRR